MTEDIQISGAADQKLQSQLYIGMYSSTCKGLKLDWLNHS